MYLIVIVVDGIVLYILSRLITSAFSSLIHSKTRKRHLTIQLFSFLFLPGTFLHELSHIFVAWILGVRTFDFVIRPIALANSVRLGSVGIGRSDIIRRTLIGIAPLIIGIGSLFLCIWWLSLPQSHGAWEYAVAGIFVFQVSSMMFPSKKDIEGKVGVFILFLLGLAVASLWICNALPLAYAIGSWEFSQLTASYLTIVVVIDTLALLLLRIALHTVR
ncbi:MAG: hypothetical protein HYV40_00420 [Candidatus Levybacteria bacterium]|nr:hypothetical protein [Candidatus Levybacteria bacterium]